MGWTAVIVACLSHLTSSHSNNSLVNSATRKFFSADRHENIDERPGVASYHDESLPFGNLGDNTPPQLRSAELTIERFIEKLKRIQEQKNQPSHSRTKSKSEPANVLLPVKNDKQNAKKIPSELRKSKTSGRSTTKTRNDPRKRKNKGLKKKAVSVSGDVKRQKEATKSGAKQISKQSNKKKSIAEVNKKKSETSSINKKQKKFHKPSFGSDGAGKNIKKQVEEDFFQSGIPEPHQNIHHHDHLHAHKAFHKHKEKFGH